MTTRAGRAPASRRGQVIVAALLAIATGGVSPVEAQPASPTPADSVAPAAAEPAPEFFRPGGSLLSRWKVSPYGDLRLRFELTHQRPGFAEDLRRGRAGLRAGLRWAPDARFEAEAGASARIGTDRNEDPTGRFDNEPSDTLDLDRLGLRFTPWPRASLLVGKFRSPLRLTELIWDDDLRPVGVAAAVSAPIRAFDAVRIGAGAFHRSRLDHDASVAAAQIGYSWRDGAAAGAEALASWLRFDRLDELASQGLGRQNRTRVTPGGRAYDTAFELLDARLDARLEAAGVPLGARLDWVRNRAAASDRDGVRLRVSAGDLAVRWHTEAGYVFQETGREAVPGAFNSDDWWFHSRARGHSAWIAIALHESLVLRATGFVERRADLGRSTSRLLVDLVARLPGD